MKSLLTLLVCSLPILTNSAITQECKGSSHLHTSPYYKMLKQSHEAGHIDLGPIESLYKASTIKIEEPYEHHQIVRDLYDFIISIKEEKPFIKELCKEVLYTLDSKPVETEDGLYKSKLYLDEMMQYLVHPDKEVATTIESVTTTSELKELRSIFEKSFRVKDLYDNEVLNQEMKTYLGTKEAKAAKEKGEDLEALFYSQRIEKHSKAPSWDLFFNLVTDKALSKSVDIYVAKEAKTKKPLGFLWINKEYEHIHMVSYLAKDPQAVHLEIGKKLFDHVKKHAPGRYVLQVIPENEAAMSLYKSVGFVKHTVRRKKKNGTASKMVQMVADYRNREKEREIALH
ncbi:MAG: hypothetical protein S4CHLAM37_16110 [Chlamydiia bacterium]|nr:hypothetical protein [Chlamydiia bacterium]